MFSSLNFARHDLPMERVGELPSVPRPWSNGKTPVGETGQLFSGSIADFQGLQATETCPSPVECSTYNPFPSIPLYAQFSQCYGEFTGLNNFVLTFDESFGPPPVRSCSEIAPISTGGHLQLSCFDGKMYLELVASPGYYTAFANGNGRADPLFLQFRFQAGPPGLPTSGAIVTVTASPPSVPWNTIDQWDIFGRDELCWLAKVGIHSYDSTPDALNHLGLNRLGKRVEDFITLNTLSTIPGSAIYTLPELTIIFVSGTSNRYQWFDQLTQAAAGQTDYGSFSTIGVWYDAATAMLDRLVLVAASMDTPTLWAGHSMGGAVASIGAARDRLARPAKKIKVVTFGAPKAGDQRLAGILESLEYNRVEGVNDLVTAVPMDVRNSAALYALTGPIPIYNMSQFIHPRNGNVVHADGSFARQIDPPVLAMQIVNCMIAWWTGGAAPGDFDHFMTTYARRICPDGQ